jgi:AcrR family transcriptional regulator
MTRRVKNAAATREAMLVSARERFLRESFENVGLREIAADAGVDVALVGRYFGSKEGLFREVLHSGKSDWLDPAVPAEELPALLAALATREFGSEDREDIDRLLIILRSASSPKAASIVQESFRENVLEPVARVAEGEEAEMRASLALSLLIGTTILRTIMEVDAFTECKAERVRMRMKSLFEVALLRSPAQEPLTEASLSRTSGRPHSSPLCAALPPSPDRPDGH